MKVLLINGSPHSRGCTYTALHEAEKQFNKNGIDADIFWIGAKPISGCISCERCDGRCVLPDDGVNSAIEQIEQADGLIIGSPVYYASPNGALLSLLDRVFYAKKSFAGKPGGAIVSARRAGTTASLDVLNKYFVISGMPIVSSQYWCMVHGNRPEEVMKDEEGLQTVRTLADNMTWLLRCIEAGKRAGVNYPEREAELATNFIR